MPTRFINVSGTGRARFTNVSGTGRANFSGGGGGGETTTTSTTTTTTTEAPIITCSNYEIINGGGVPISWSGNNCVTNASVGGEVNPGQTVFTGCIRDNTFSYGSNGSVTVNFTQC